MSSRSLSTRLARLDALSERLCDGALHSIASLAQEFGISARTLARDIALLREQGWELASATGKGGGIQIAQRWPVGRMTLRSEEALELLMALALSQALGFTPSLQHAHIRRQLSRCFAPTDRHHIGKMRQRIRIASPVSMAVQSAREPEVPGTKSALYRAFTLQHGLSITYRDAQDRLSHRDIEPQYLLLAWPFWYVLAWDAQRQAVRTFRLDRIEQATVEPTRFALRPAAPFWTACNEVGIVL